MFFTRIGITVAHLMFWLGLIHVALAFFFAFGTEDMENNRLAARRYLGAETTGEAIDEGMQSMLTAIALGVLCEISKRRKKAAETA